MYKFFLLSAFVPNTLCDYKTNVFDNKILDSNTDVIMNAVPVQSPVLIPTSESYTYPFSHLKQPDDITRNTVKHLEKTDYDQLMILVKNNWLLLKVIENQTGELCKVAIMNDPPISTFYEQNGFLFRLRELL